MNMNNMNINNNYNYNQGMQQRGSLNPQHQNQRNSTLDFFN